MEDDLSVFMTDAWVEEAGTQNGAAYQASLISLKRARDGKMPLEIIIRKLSGATADRFDIEERGNLKPGFFADVTVFDYDNIVVDPKVPDFTPNGFKHVFVNGTQVLNDGKYITAAAGQVILKKRPKSDKV